RVRQKLIEFIVICKIIQFCPVDFFMVIRSLHVCLEASTKIDDTGVPEGVEVLYNTCLLSLRISTG
ncbi:MAG: hypothetical protein LUP98_07825, partial [Methylococcaceae bacterium]|nr:hypothetical protein [Methylococcaceae bacterium]